MKRVLFPTRPRWKNRWIWNRRSVRPLGVSIDGNGINAIFVVLEGQTVGTIYPPSLSFSAFVGIIVPTDRNLRFKGKRREQGGTKRKKPQPRLHELNHNCNVIIKLFVFVYIYTACGSAQSHLPFPLKFIPFRHRLTARIMG